MTDTKRIESYGLYDFCKDIQEALNEGYVFDFDTNENFPTAYGTMLTCGLVKAGKVEVVETDSQTEQTNEEVKDEEQIESTDTTSEQVEGSDTETKPEGSEVAPEVKPEGSAEAPAATGKRGPNKNKAK